MKNKSYLLLVFIFIILVSCKKKETYDLHVNHTDSTNIAPPYSGVTTLSVQNYVNKLYVDLLSREPLQPEMDAAVNALKTGNYDDASKTTLINSLINTRAFYEGLYTKTSNRMLNSTGKADIQAEIAFETYLISYYTTLMDYPTVNLLIVQRGNLTKMYEADSLLQLGQININQFFYRMLYNYFYDQVNMGSENFVKASFQDLFYRQPTTAEKDAGVSMVDGTPAIVLQAAGNNKGDYVNIVTNSNAFYEGIITEIYLTYLLRKPTDAEVNSVISSLSTSHDYVALIRNILKTKEYAGF